MPVAELLELESLLEPDSVVHEALGRKVGTELDREVLVLLASVVSLEVQSEGLLEDGAACVEAWLRMERAERDLP